MRKFSKEEIDIITEICNMGSGNAAKALSTLSGSYIEPRQPEVLLVSKEDIEIVVHKKGEKLVYGNVEIEGNIRGKAVFGFTRGNALRLMRVISKSTCSEAWDEAALKEVFNIFTGNYLGAMGNFLGIRVLHSVPTIEEGEVSKLTKLMLGNPKVKEVICIKTEIRIEKYNIQGFFMLLMDNLNLKRLLAYIASRFNP